MSRVRFFVFYLFLFCFFNWTDDVYGRAHRVHQVSGEKVVKSADPRMSDSVYFVQNCHDGDTCRVKNQDGFVFKIRLVGIDAPELALTQKGVHRAQQPFGRESKVYLNRLIKHKSVLLKLYGTDLYGRNLAEIFLNHENINLQMVAAGMAHVYRAYVNEMIPISDYNAAEQQARRQKLGLWSVDHVVDPHQWRHQSGR